ncbi:hypothetical protein CBL_13465 [Carabus blaptoides fortunei]
MVQAGIFLNSAIADSVKRNTEMPSRKSSKNTTETLPENNRDARKAVLDFTDSSNTGMLSLMIRASTTPSAQTVSIETSLYTVEGAKFNHSVQTSTLTQHRQTLLIILDNPCEK